MNAIIYWRDILQSHPMLFLLPYIFVINSILRNSGRNNLSMLQIVITLLQNRKLERAWKSDWYTNILKPDKILIWRYAMLLRKMKLNDIYHILGLIILDLWHLHYRAKHFQCNMPRNNKPMLTSCCFRQTVIKR